MVLERAAVDVSQMLHAVIALTREHARSRGLDVSLRCPPQIGTIEGDERRLKQALFNLISNAIRFTPPGGTIGIEARRSGDEVLLSVADKGIGVVSGNRARRFEKFGSRSRPTGSGLGLSLVKNLVELHGGSVEVEEAEGRGLRVTCRLPGRALGLLRGPGTVTPDCSHELAQAPSEVAA